MGANVTQVREKCPLYLSVLTHKAGGSFFLLPIKKNIFWHIHVHAMYCSSQETYGVLYSMKNMTSLMINWEGMPDKPKIPNLETMTNIVLHCIQKPANSYSCKVNNLADVKRKLLINTGTVLQFHAIILNELTMLSSIRICSWFRKC